MSQQTITGDNGETFYKTKVFAVSRPGIKPDEMLDGYGSWIDTYDKDMESVEYNGPRTTAAYVKKCFPNASGDSIRILDIGCGTGLVAAELRKLGYTNVDGLDPSGEMLQKAREQNLYVNYLKEFLTADPLNIPDNSYDCVAGSGCLAIGHMPSESLYEVIRLTKPGGYVIITTRVNMVEETEYYKDFEPLTKRLEEQGKWKIISRDVFPQFYKGKEGINFVFQVL